jgi:DNA invertase Pin-like site-specific DNA recombinase
VRSIDPGSRPRAGLYTRISLDRKGAGLGVERQEDDCRKLARRRGFDVVTLYSDNDISAYSGKRRPGYCKLLADIKSGSVDVVVAWHTDRLHRSPAELEEYIEACERRGVDTVTVQAGELDLSTASGKLVARMLGAAARHESEQKAERVSRARQQAAEHGEAHGPLGYGYNADQTINPAEAEIVSELARRILAGETLFAMATDLNRRGVPTPGGKIGAWRSVTIRQTMMRASLAGWREWKSDARGKPGQSKPGQFVARGSWAPIFDRPVVEDMRRLLTDPSRRTSRRRPISLLTGVVQCSKCDNPMSYSFDKRYDTGKYVCASQPGLGRCGRTGIVAPAVDDMVSQAVVGMLVSSAIPTARRRGQGDLSVAEKELVEARNDRQELAAQRAARAISAEEWSAMRPVLTDRIKRAEQAISAAGGSLAILKGVPTGLRARKWWAEADMDQRRLVVRALIEKVPIYPATKISRSGVFDSARVGDPIWRV